MGRATNKNGKSTATDEGGDFWTSVVDAYLEVHSDAQQAIGLRAFEALAQDARALADLDGRRIVNLSDPAPHELSPR